MLSIQEMLRALNEPSDDFALQRELHTITTYRDAMIFAKYHWPSNTMFGPRMESWIKYKYDLAHVPPKEQRGDARCKKMYIEIKNSFCQPWLKTVNSTVPAHRVNFPNLRTYEDHTHYLFGCYVLAVDQSFQFFMTKKQGFELSRLTKNSDMNDFRTSYRGDGWNALMKYHVTPDELKEILVWD
jgi:hypothetical protein